MQRKLSSMALLAGFSLMGNAQAALIDRGGGLIYDDVLNITWLQDANYGAGSSYDNGSSLTDGRMNWDDAVAWADTLVFHDSVRNVDYSDWRLPTMIDTGNSGCDWGYNGTDCGYNVQTFSAGTTYSELAYMYYVNFDNRSPYSPPGPTNPVVGLYEDLLNSTDESLFTNLQFSTYWTGLEMQGTDIAWAFYTSLGEQSMVMKFGELYAWAVRPGDVAASNNNTVPEPQSLALLGLGLAGLMAARRRR